MEKRGGKISELYNLTINFTSNTTGTWTGEYIYTENDTRSLMLHA